MKSAIYTGEVRHTRIGPVEHHFRHAFYFYAFDLLTLKRLHQKTPGFAINRFAPVSLRDRDYLREGSASIAHKASELIAAHWPNENIERVVLVTSARYFGYVFNPVSFHLLFDANNQLKGMIAEVNNTFKEKHIYLVHDFEQEGTTWIPREATLKDFHVSPFNDMDGEYKFLVHIDGDQLKIEVNLEREGQRVLSTYIRGTARPFTSINLWKTIARYPFRAALTTPRILLEAARLHYKKKLPIHQKPKPESSMTIRNRPATLKERIALRLISRALNGIKKGSMQITLPDGSIRIFGTPDEEPAARIVVNEWRFFTRILSGGSVAFGEAFVDKDWDSENVTDVLKVFIHNNQAIQRSNLIFSAGVKLANRLYHQSRTNNKSNSRKNIQEHYDLGNDFYQTFLDTTMTYSSGIFHCEQDTLEMAQMNKINHIIAKAQLEPNHHVLEIGSGWGSFAIQAAKTTGCRVTSVTLSDEQYALATERVKEAGLEDLVEIKICDYRDIDGKYDRIISIEMLEAVGHEYLEAYFAKCDELLKPKGKAVIQVITIPEERYSAYRRGCDWIQKHIFPGGFLPSLGSINQAMTKASALTLHKTEDIGKHYAITLREWHERFVANREQVQQLGFYENFQRKWEYYLCYCEAGFETQYIHDLQLELQK